MSSLQPGWAARFLASNLAMGVAGFLLIIYGARVGMDLWRHIFEAGYLATDFICYWMASNLLLSGQGTVFYDFEAFNRFLTAMFDRDGMTFLYPPTWLFFIWPTSLLPYSLSVIVFEAVTAGLLALAATGFARTKHAAALIFLFPPLFICMIFGQNGMLNAALLTGAMACLGRNRQVLAGVLIGLMSYKPHFGLLIPFALLAGGYYRTFLSAAVVTLAMAALSVSVFGLEIWRSFLDQLPFASQWLMGALAPKPLYASLFGFLRQLDVPPLAALWCQIAVGIVCFLLVVWGWAQRAVGLPWKAALLASAAVAATPYCLIYDLPILIIPAIVLFQQGRRSGFLRYEAEAILLSMGCMIASNGWGLSLQVSAAVAVPLLAVAVSARRVLHEARQGAGAPAPSLA